MQNKLRLIRPSSMLALILWIGAWPLVAADNSSILNVRDFGAKGDNSTDDTAAIQAAFDAQRKAPYSEVVFPAGIFRVRDTIKVYSPNARGQGATTIFQETEGKDIFYVEFAWRGTIRDIGFAKGAKQLNMGNPNTDQGLVRVEDCTFTDSSDFAIYMRKGSYSSHLVVRGCVFSNCAQVLHATCDWTTMGDCWITTARMHNKAAIENRSGKLLCENIDGVPIVTGEGDRWIDNYGDLTCLNFRFGGEFGGFTPVYNFATTSKGPRGPKVVIEDSNISAEGSGRKCAVWCEAVPNTLVIRDCELTVPAVMVNPKLDLAQAFAHIPPGLLQFDLQSNPGKDNDDPQTLALLQAAKRRDVSPEPLKGQWTSEQTKAALAQIVERVKKLPPSTTAPSPVNGHTQKTDPKDYVELTGAKTKWDLDDFMDATTLRNGEVIAQAEAGDATVFMRRYAPADGGVWPHALIRDVTIDLDKYPWLSWRQKDPGGDPLPPALVKREGDLKLDPGVVMPMGFSLKIMDNETKRLVALHETHTPPWFDYGAKDLRKLFDVKGGKRAFTIKYYPLGVYITGQPGSGFALPGEYQILDFIRAESD